MVVATFTHRPLFAFVFPDNPEQDSASTNHGAGDEEREHQNQESERCPRRSEDDQPGPVDQTKNLGEDSKHCETGRAYQETGHREQVIHTDDMRTANAIVNRQGSLPSASFSESSAR